MPTTCRHFRPACSFVLAVLMGSVLSARGAEPVAHFSRDVLPILSNRCYTCHGPDEAQRQADLRLDLRESAVAAAIVPNHPEKSPLIERVATADPDQRMPPPDSKRPPLAPPEIELLRRWIAQGAPYDSHWAYQPPRRPALPEAKRAGWEAPIDRLISAGHAAQGLQPSPEADRRTLIRRLSLDLVGLPPSPQDVGAFEADASPAAYERLVDRLLASPYYGERMAVAWLDVARFADSCGYHSDNPRNVWLYRDYVIEAFNANRPFDQFTIEQLAGDLLPGATRLQRIASGYNRLLQTTEEGGAQAKEYTAKYAADRVRNASTAWLGSTVGCAECHDHKYDPFKTKDFYRFAAFFADVKENAIARQEELKMPTPDQEVKLREFDRAMAPLRKTLETRTPELDAAQAEWEQSVRQRDIAWIALKPESAVSEGAATMRILADGSVQALGKNPEKDTYTITVTTDLKGITAFRLDVLPEPSLVRGGPGRSANGNFVLNEFEAYRGAEALKWAHVSGSHSQAGYPVQKAADGDRETGWAILDQVGQPQQAVFETTQGVGDGRMTRLVFVLRQLYGGSHTIGKLRLSATTMPRPIRVVGQRSLPEQVAAALAVEPSRRTEAQQNAISAYYRSIAPPLAAVRQQLAELQRRRDEFDRTVPTTLVTEAIAPRTVRVLPRGDWQSDSGEVVEPGTPEFLGKLAVKDRRANRLDLARWLVSRDNPLVARVFVNRVWRQLFGQGIVKTVDDFGAQGALPSHPALLDWLSVDFVESGWDVKRLVRQIVLSRSYRQSSDSSDDQLRRDPANVWLARQGRFRLDAELVRDNALAISGLLSPKIGGPSVKPYQPDGYWSYLNFPPRTWTADVGEEQHRRGLYTHWQRTFLHPSLLAFDAPTREECAAERPRSNTPLQALVLLNDPSYVEAARALALKAIREGGPEVGDRVQYAMRRSLGRPASAGETAALAELYRKHREQYAQDPGAARRLLEVGQSKAPADVPPADLAAWTSVARAILNLHETITRN